MTDSDFGFRPDEAIENQKQRRKREAESLEQLVSQVQNDPNATKTQKKIASALLALKES